MRNELLIQATLAAFLLAAFTSGAKADVITDWNIKAGDIVVESKLGTPPAIRVMALVQTAVTTPCTPAPGGNPTRGQAFRSRLPWRPPTA